MVEQNRSGAYTQFVYGPHGGKFAIMSGQTLQKAIIPLIGGSQAVYNASGLLYYGHSDHLGSIRLGSSSSRSVSFDVAYAPFGETYASSGSADPAFTSQRQDTVSGLYDFPAREYGTEGRWPSPDPSGIAAFYLTDPQSINRYVYARNTPLSVIDPTGLIAVEWDDDYEDWGGGGGGGGGIEGGAGDPTSGGSQDNSGSGCGSDDPACAGIPSSPTFPSDPFNNPLAPAGPGPGPGDTFSNIMDAGAIAAAYAAWHGGDGEWGGEIYQNPDGTYSFDAGRIGNAGGVNIDPSAIPDGTTFVGDYHSHGDIAVDSLETFSPGDIPGINRDYTNYPNYQAAFLSTPQRNVKVYIPEIPIIATVCSACSGPPTVNIP